MDAENQLFQALGESLGLSAGLKYYSQGAGRGSVSSVLVVLVVLVLLVLPLPLLLEFKLRIQAFGWLVVT